MSAPKPSAPPKPPKPIKPTAAREDDGALDDEALERYVDPKGHPGAL